MTIPNEQKEQNIRFYSLYSLGSIVSLNNEMEKYVHTIPTHFILYSSYCVSSIQILNESTKNCCLFSRLIFFFLYTNLVFVCAFFLVGNRINTDVLFHLKKRLRD